jgi:sugar lactone lactonase YvrE
MVKHQRKVVTLSRVMSLLILFVSFAGCVSQPTPTDTKKPTETVFYPAPPEPPRYQFLKSFKGPEDFNKKETSFLGSSGAGTVQVKKPYGIIIRDGVISVGDTTTGVYQFDLKNKQFLAFKGSKGLGKIVGPINLSTDKEGNTYVCDSERKQVLQYDKNDFFIRAFSNQTPWRPVDAEAFEGKLYVADSTKMTGGVKVFDQKTGQFLEAIGIAGQPEEKVGMAVNIAFDHDGYLYVMDAYTFSIMKYDRDGHYRGRLGGPGDSPGFFGRPRGVAVDRAGKIYAVDGAFDVVQVFASTGQLLTYFGDAEDAEPGALTLPAGIFLDYDNIDYFKEYAAPGFEIEYLILVTSQFNAKQVINVYAYGKMQGAKYKTDQELFQELQEKLRREKAEKQQ